MKALCGWWGGGGVGPNSRQTCDSDIMNGLCKTSPGAFRNSAFFVTGGAARWIQLCDLGKGTHSNPEGAAFQLRSGPLSSTPRAVHCRSFGKRKGPRRGHRHRRRASDKSAQSQTFMSAIVSKWIQINNISPPSFQVRFDFFFFFCNFQLCVVNKSRFKKKIKVNVSINLTHITTVIRHFSVIGEETIFSL